MYTQCPECDVAFRVTAEVLKQAAGKVRCGGCGIAFNALLYLSEENPTTTRRADPAPDNTEFNFRPPAELEADTPPKSISAAQSAALLKTLDQLAGDDIRIEDTGVEWRVLDPDEDDYDDEFAADPTPTVAHEPMRFDDNTPLPDDFDLEARSAAEIDPQPPINFVEPVRSMEDSQVDLVFGEPDEWEDLLGALEDAAAAPVVESIKVDVPLDMDTQFAIQAEAMGIDLSGMHRKAEIAQAAVAEVAEPEEQLPAPEEQVADAAETSIDDDLIAAAFEAEAAARALAADDVAPEDLSRAGILDEDDYLEVISETEPEHEPEPEPEPEEVAEDEVLEATAEHDLDAELELALDDMLEEEVEFATELSDFDEQELIEVPEPTEEERTINFLIDQDLLAIAVEDEDGFTSTIVQKQFSSAAEIPREQTSQHLPAEDVPDSEIDFATALMQPGAIEKQPAAAEESNPLMETIIMEGDLVHHDHDTARLAAERRTAVANLRQSEQNKGRHGERDMQPRRYGMLGAAALLFIVLIAQVIHHSREAFATSPAFQKTIGPIYRMVGSPVTPAWNVSGWRFEATKGSTDEATQVLTIYSRIGNKSQEALPYPLVHVSLTDRFEEIIGSRVLEPAGYLVGAADPRRVVAAGDSFDAVFTIESPSAEATGFKLNVCYRLSSGQLRCAIEDFK